MIIRNSVFASLACVAAGLCAIAPATSAAETRHVPAPPFRPEDLPARPANPPALRALVGHIYGIAGACSAATARSIAGPALVAGDERLSSSVIGVETADNFISWMTLGFRLTVQRLIDNGDALLGRRQLCLGMYRFDQGPNAVSYDSGYILFDPRMVSYAREAGVFAETFVLFHEFAHQLQFMFPDRSYASDRTVRRRELAADCIAGALTRATLTGIQMSFQGMQGRALAFDLGDFGALDPQHHGTPVERRDAVIAGFTRAASRIAGRSESTAGITSKWLLDVCRSDRQ